MEKLKRNFYFTASFLFLFPILLFLIKPTPLWLDECALGYNIINKSYSELFQPLEMLQVAPIGFLLVNKFIASLFAYSDFGLRLTQIIALFLIYFLIFKLNEKKFLNEKSFLFIVLFPTFIFYAFELKQYIFDVLSILYFYYTYLTNKSLNWKLLFYILLLGWMSNIGLIFSPILIASLFIKSNFKLIKYFFIYSSIICANLLFYYFLFIKNHPHRAGMDNYWLKDFMPLNQRILKFSINHLTEYFGFHGHKLDFNSVIINKIRIILLIIVGIWFFFKSEYTLLKKLIFFIPLTIAVGLSILEIYPFDAGRLTLYTIIPFIFLSKSKIQNTTITYSITFLLLIHFNYSFFMNKILNPPENIKSLFYTSYKNPTHLIVDGSAKKHVLFYQSQLHEKTPFSEITYVKSMEQIIKILKTHNNQSDFLITSAHSGVFLNSTPSKLEFENLLQENNISKIVETYQIDEIKSFVKIRLK